MRARRRITALALLGATACGSGGDNDVGGFAHVPEAADLVGAYEVTTTRGHTITISVGAIGMNDDGVTVTLTDPPASLHGTLDRDGTIALLGQTTDTDANRFVDGNARAELSNGTLRLAGTFDRGDALTMVRPFGTDQSAQSGRYRIRFRPIPRHSQGDDGTVDVTLSVERAGFTRIDAGPEREADGTTVATWSFARIIVAPTGRFHIVTQYDPVARADCLFGPCHVRVTGFLPFESSDAPTIGAYVQLDGLSSFLSAGVLEVTRLDAMP